MKLFGVFAGIIVTFTHDHLLEFTALQFFADILEEYGCAHYLFLPLCPPKVAGNLRLRTLLKEQRHKPISHLALQLHWRCLFDPFRYLDSEPLAWFLCCQVFHLTWHCNLWISTCIERPHCMVVFFDSFDTFWRRVQHLLILRFVDARVFHDIAERCAI